jgi:lipoprotein signal peptidase
MASSNSASARSLWLRMLFPVRRSTVQREGKLGQGSIVLALIAAVVVVDQAMKWWAWQHVAGATINSGGDVLVGSTIGGWFADPVKGALLDLLDVGLLTVASLVMLRRPVSVAVLATGSAMIGGWSSNLLDRLIMHFWTAPGSVRGVVDFIHVGHHYYNVADFVIIGATPLFLIAVGAQYLRRSVPKRPARYGSKTATFHRHRNRGRIAILVGVVGLTVVVGTGAANDSGANKPVTASASTSAPAH